MIFDGDCNFCRRWILAWQEWTQGKVDFIASQEPGVREKYPEISAEAYDQSVQLIETDGEVYTGAEAVFRSLSYARGKGWLLWLYHHAPFFAAISERFYKVVAANRMPFSRITRFLLPAEPSSYYLFRSIFLRGLGLIYLAAFLSLWVQVTGLVGEKGILPADQFIKAASEEWHGIERWLNAPTLCWLNSGDWFLLSQSAVGTLLSVLLVLGIVPLPCTAGLWMLYLSLTSICRDFLSFQWENLLLETGLIAILLAPWSLTLKTSERPPTLAIWLLRWLLFRLMFLSGVVKLLSGDPTYRNFTALFYHYETQPLPTSLGWWVYQLPTEFHVASLGVMFMVELVVPFFVLAPRGWRLWTFWPLVGLQLAIALTGNYCFFNLLTILLCFSVWDDAALKRFSWGKFRSMVERRLELIQQWREERKPSRLLEGLRTGRGVVLLLFAILVLFISGIQLLATLRWKRDFSKPVLWIYAMAQPFRSINTYGLFSVMTTTRPEIIIEGSHDGKNWAAYEFNYKPGDLTEAPKFVAPHQPRLDWQMWFAALSNYQRNPWFVNLCLRLLQGEKEVLRLLEKNPFPDKAPKYIRAELYEYRFTTGAEKKKTGQWWERTYKGNYLPAISLEGVSESRR